MMLPPDPRTAALRVRNDTQPRQDQHMATLRAVALFIAAGLAEIGGGYLIWRWLRENAPVITGILGAITLVAYGVIPTLQQSDDFGRIYAAYGGVLVIASLLRAGASTANSPTATTGRAPQWSRRAWP